MDADKVKGMLWGLIADACYGFTAIPERWVKAIKDQASVAQLIDTFVAQLA